MHIESQPEKYSISHLCHIYQIPSPTYHSFIFNSIPPLDIQNSHSTLPLFNFLFFLFSFRFPRHILVVSTFCSHLIEFPLAPLLTRSILEYDFCVGFRLPNFRPKSLIQENMASVLIPLFIDGMEFVCYLRAVQKPVPQKPVPQKPVPQKPEKSYC